MTRIAGTQFILRVDGCGLRPAGQAAAAAKGRRRRPEPVADAGLEYFRAWRRATGLDRLGSPVYWAFNAWAVGDAERAWLRTNLDRAESIAIYGSRDRGAAGLMRRDREALELTATRPPTAYVGSGQDRELASWCMVTRPAMAEFFGRPQYDPAEAWDHTRCPSQPTIAENVLYVPAHLPVCDHSSQQLPAVLKYWTERRIDWPMVVAVNLLADDPRDPGGRERLNQLGQALRSVRLVDLWEAWKWARRHAEFVPAATLAAAGPPSLVAQAEAN